MKRLIPKQKIPVFNNSIDYLHNKTRKWISEIEFTKIEQGFLKELLVEHVMSSCTSTNFTNAKLLLKGILHENILSGKLIESIQEHRVNLSLLLENIYLKKEDAFRKDHEYLKIELINYMDNFKYIKEQVFELALQILKEKKQQKLLHE